MINLNDYDGLTEQAVDEYIATLTIPEPDIRMDGDEVYKNGSLWFRVACQMDLDTIKQMAIEQYVDMACTAHFADCHKPYEPPEPVEPIPEPTEEELAQAELLLNQMDIINKQQEQDEVLAAILLNGLGV